MQLIVENRLPIKDPDNKDIEDALLTLVGNEGKEPGFAILDPESTNRLYRV